MPMRRRRMRSSRDSQGGAIDDGADPSTDGASGDNDTTSSSGNVREWPESLDHHQDTAAPPQPRPAAEPPRGSPETTLLATTTSSSSTSSSVTASNETADTALTAARREALLAADPDATTAACVGGASSAGNTQPRDIPCTDRPPRRSASPGSERGIAVVRPPQYSNLVVREEPRRPVSSPRPPPPPPPPLPRLPRGVRRTPSFAPGGTRRGSLASAPHGIGSTIPHRNNTSRLLGRLEGTGTGADASGNIAGIPAGGGVAPRPSFFDMIPDNTDEPAGGSPPSAAATTTGARAGAATAAARGRNRPATRFRRVAAAPSGREPPGNITGVRRRGSTEGTGLVSNVGHGDGAPGQAGATAGATAGGGESSAAGAAGASGAADSSSTSNVGGGREAGGSAAAAAGSGGAAGGGGGAGEESRTPAAAAAASTTIHQLHKASVVGDLTAISRFIEDGGNLEAQSFCGRTALHYAAFYGHADVARALILGGANVCSRGGGNSTPLHFAAWGGNKRVVRLLLEYGADVEARDTEGNTPQAYSEDDELYEMLVRARRRLFPLPSSLSGGMEKRPLRAIAAYSALLVACMYISAALVVTWASSASTAEEESLMTDGGGGGGLSPPGITTPFWLSVGIGGKAAAAAAAAGAQAASGGAGAGEGVPSLVFWTALPVALLAGLAPAVAFAIGFKRKTDAYWRSVKDRDMEIVRLRHREQASGGWPPATHLGAAMDAARASAAAAAGTAGGTPSSGPGAVRFMTPSPRGISRGEQAGQAVIARLSRLQAAPGAAAGVVAPGGGMRGGAGAGGHIHHNHNPELQMQIRRYHQAMMAVGGVAAAGGGVVAGAGGVAGGGGNGGGRGRPGVQVAQ